MFKRILPLFVAVLLFSFTPEKPRVLIIGDSISIGYTPYVKDYLREKAEVIHNTGNAQHTGTGLKKIEEWIGNEEWDIIQFNWGLWDLAYRHIDAETYGNRDKVNGTVYSTVEQYRSNLDSLVIKIKSLSDAKLIFVTTSYVPEGEAGRFKKDPIRYNKAAKQVMKKHGVIINDIYKQSRNIHRSHATAPNDVHYSKEGYSLLGKEISDFISEQL